MKVEASTSSSILPRLRLSVTLVIVLMVISSPVVMEVNPALIAAPFSAPSTLSQDGSDFTTQAALSSLSARPTNNIVNTNSFYDVVFLAATSGTIKTIEVTFPVGTTIPSGAFFNEAEKCVPGSDCTEMTGTVSKSGQTIIYTVTNAVNVPAGSKIRLEFANINNPLNPSSAYQVTVTTRDAANAIIDGPSQSTAYTIKQIGQNAIAESFMKRVTVLDNPIGNSIGWNPNGAIRIFDIIEPEIVNQDVTHVDISAAGVIAIGGQPLCDLVEFILIDGSRGFRMFCHNPPVDGTDLNYLVTNLPSNLIG